jgi:hypothetical protein
LNIVALIDLGQFGWLKPVGDNKKKEGGSQGQPLFFYPCVYRGIALTDFILVGILIENKVI